MVKQHSQLLNSLLAAGDLLVVAAAWSLSYKLRFTFLPAPLGLPQTSSFLANLLIVLLVALVVLAGTGLYRPRRDKSFLLELGQILKASLIIWVLAIVLIYYTSSSPFTRAMLALFLPLLMAGLTLERGLYRALLRTLRRRGWNLRHALIIGTGRLAQSAALRIQRNSWTGIRITGYIAPEEPCSEIPSQLPFTNDPSPSAPDPIKNPKSKIENRQVRGLPILGTTSQLLDIIHSTHIDSVFIALPANLAELTRHVLADLEKTAVDVRIIPDLFLSRFPTNVAIGELDGLPIVTLREDPLAGWPALYKRAFDIAGALFGITLFALPMLLIALAIKLQKTPERPVTDETIKNPKSKIKNPAFYSQRRMSYGRHAFNMLKFRTMIPDAEAAGPVFTDKNDPRVTPLGRWLRSTSLDELPQLFNVLKGDMSLVGPRPERPEMLEKIQQEVPGFPLRLKVRAGLTGWAQINGYRGKTSFRKRLQYDLYYLNNWSPLLDLRIVLATLYRGFKHPNAY